MAKQTPKDTKKTTPKPEPAPVTSASSPEPASDSAIDSRLSVPLDKDGEVLLDNMRDKTRAKLRELVTDAKLARALGVNPSESAAASSSMLPPELMYPLVSGLSILDMMLVARLTNAPRELIERVVPYTSEETRTLAPKIAVVLDKYGATNFLSKYREEVELAGTLISLSVQKVIIIRAEMEKLGPRGVVVPMVPPSPEPPPSAPGTPETVQ